MRKPRGKSGSVLWGVGLLVLICAVSAYANGIPMPAKHHSDAYKQVKRVENLWHKALLASDTAAMNSLLADSYVGIGPDGTITGKVEEVQAFAERQDHIDQFEADDEKIRLYGSTAVVTSKITVRGVFSGQPLLGKYRYTRVWSLQGGQWRIVSFEASRIHDTSSRQN